MKILIYNKDLPPWDSLKKENDIKDDKVIWTQDKGEFLGQLETYDFDLVLLGGELLEKKDIKNRSIDF